jgi:2'-5' RNA ligase
VFEQAALPGLDAPSAGGDVLFFAVLPDVQAAEWAHELAWRLRARHGFHAKPMARERLHVSLQGLGAFKGVPTEALEIAEQAARRCDQLAFDVCFDRAVSFSGAGEGADVRAYVLRESHRSQGLQALHWNLSLGLRALGQASTASRGFTPHMTLLYDRRRVAEEQIEPVRWRVKSIALIRSQSGSGRPYEILQRWSLKAPETST